MKNLTLEVEAEWNTNNSFDWDENFIKMGEDLYLYTDYHNIKNMETSDLITIKASSKKEALLDVYYECSDYSYLDEENNKKEITESVYNLKIGDLLSRSWLNREDELDSLEVTRKFEIITIHGNRQGEVLDIIVPHALAKIWGMTKKKLIEECKDERFKETLSNYAYGTPICGTFNLEYKYYMNCVEYTVSLDDDLREYLKDVYEMEFNVDAVVYTIEKQMHRPMTEKEKKDLGDTLSLYDYNDVSYPCHCAA